MDLCAVCFQRVGRRARKLPCAHRVHRRCKGASAPCPLCAAQPVLLLQLSGVFQRNPAHDAMVAGIDPAPAVAPRIENYAAFRARVREEARQFGENLLL